MKKAWLLSLVSLVIVLVISGCGSKDTRDFNIENHNWTFSNMVSSETGEVTACGETVKDQFPDVQVVAMTCVAEGGSMTVGSTDGSSLEFQYQASGKDTNSLIYELEYHEGNELIKGMAVSSITEYAKGKYEYTLVVDIDGFALYFYEKIEE